jgi:hypothetical protein
MQLLHAIHNLVEILKQDVSSKSSVPPLEAGAAALEDADPAAATVSSTLPQGGPAVPQSAAATSAIGDAAVLARIASLEERAIRESTRFTSDTNFRIVQAESECDKVAATIEFGSKEWVANAFDFLSTSDVAHTVLDKVAACTRLHTFPPTLPMRHACFIVSHTISFCTDRCNKILPLWGTRRDEWPTK